MEKISWSRGLPHPLWARARGTRRGLRGVKWPLFPVRDVVSIAVLTSELAAKIGVMSTVQTVPEGQANCLFLSVVTPRHTARASSIYYEGVVSF